MILYVNLSDESNGLSLTPKQYVVLDKVTAQAVLTAEILSVKPYYHLLDWSTGRREINASVVAASRSP